MKTERSTRLFQTAKEVMPGGVNSPVRAFHSVGRDPIYMERAKGAELWDLDGNRYVDLIGSWGPMILGHSDDRVIAKISEVLLTGTSFGTCSVPEVDLAKKIIELVPSVEMVRMTSSGTEATMSVIRLARGFTGRDKMIKFEGCYHGHADSFLIKAGSGVVTLGLPDSPGVTKTTAKDTLTAQFNDMASVRTLIEANKDEIAAVLIEPVSGNMGCVPSTSEFLSELRSICDDNGILLIFDEVMTGFRLARGGAQELYGVRPDLSAFGKVIGGGLPVGAYGGRRDIMELIAPAGPVYQAGTLSGNPLAMTAGLETLKAIESEADFYGSLEKISASLETGLTQIFPEYTINRVGSMLTLFFTDEPVTDFASAMKSDREKFAKFFRLMLDRGVLLPPSQFEACFISIAHTEQVIAEILAAAEDSARQM
jgi:glutamate-1-semialdehyde 2,1-aminomutase